MSLFRLKSNWLTNCRNDDTEIFGVGSLAVGKLAKLSNSKEQIAVGSQSGILRIFDPLMGEESNMWASKPCSSHHILLEKNLHNPILQVEIGDFMSGADEKQLAVLHPRLLTVYSLKINEGTVESIGTQFDIIIMYEHKLHRSSYNMVYGSFGGVQGRDFVCVQSLDGCLTVLEQETQAFYRFLPQTLLPGPLVYVPFTDSFVTVSSTFSLCSYKYQVLAVAADSQTREEASTKTSGKRVSPDWTQQLGEPALELNVLEMSPAQPCILVLGQRTVYCFTEGGNIRFSNKFDYGAISLLTYSSTSEGFVQYMIGTDTSTLLFFADSTLRWAAQVGFIPLQVKISTNRMIVAIGEEGELVCGYLGTDPALYGLPTTETRHIDLTAKQLQYKKLQAKIKSSNVKEIELGNTTSKFEELSINCAVPPRLDDISLVYDSKLKDEKLPSITIRIRLEARVPLENVQLFVNAPAPVAPHQNAFSCSTLSGVQEIPVTFFVRTTTVPANLTVYMLCTYLNTAGGNKLVTSRVDLPLQLVAFADTPNKQANCKVTLESNKPTINLNDIFTEFLSAGSPGDMQSIGFRFYGSRVLSTVLVSQNTKKYRIQSDSTEATWVVLFEFWQRLHRYFMGVSNFEVTYSANLPLPEYFTLIDQHFELQKRKLKLAEVLGQRCTQLRAIQRQLLIKLKDTTPAPLSHLDGLLEVTHHQVLNIGNAMQELQAKLYNVHHAVAACTRQILFLVRLQNHMPDSEFIQVQAALTPLVDQFPDQTWEERTDAAVSHVLHMLAKGHSAASLANQLPKMSDATRLKKHITLFCEKLNKGNHVPPTRAMSAAPNKRKAPAVPKPFGSRLETIVEDTNVVDNNEDELGEGDAPVGSQFMDIKSGNLGQSRSLEEVVEEDEEEFSQVESVIGYNPPEPKFLANPDSDQIASKSGTPLSGRSTNSYNLLNSSTTNNNSVTNSPKNGRNTSSPNIKNSPEYLKRVATTEPKPSTPLSTRGSARNNEHTEEYGKYGEDTDVPDLDELPKQKAVAKNQDEDLDFYNGF